MNDEYFLNQWFSRSLKRSQESIAAIGFPYLNDLKRRAMLNIDRSLFPINLRSSECWSLPWAVSRYSSDYESSL